MQPTHPSDARELVARRMQEREAGAVRERLVTSSASSTYRLSFAARLGRIRTRRAEARRRLVVT